MKDLKIRLAKDGDTVHIVSLINQWISIENQSKRVNMIAFISTFNLIAGNLIHILLYLRTVIVEKRFALIPIALSMPFYWIFVSIGAWKGTIQLITKPHYWEKTIHGISNINNLTTI